MSALVPSWVYTSRFRVSFSTKLWLVWPHRASEGSAVARPLHSFWVSSMFGPALALCLRFCRVIDISRSLVQ